MYFITVLNDVITGLHDGDIDCDFYGSSFYGHDRIAVPDIFTMRVGDLTTFYEEGWRRKTDTALIDEGLLPMPKGYIREGDNLRQMNREERIVTGLNEPDPGTKVDRGKIVNMTMGELHEAGLISEEDWQRHKLGEAENELNNRLSEFQTPEALAMAELDEEYATERKTKLAALLAVKKQQGWPLEVVWPKEKQGKF